MRNLARVTSIMVLSSLVSLGDVYAQFQVNATANNILPIEPGRSVSGLWGGGATLRYFVSSHVAIGINGRHFGKSYNLNFGTEAYRGKTNITMLTGQAEYFITQTKLQPYLGIESGLYNSKDIGETSGQPTISTVSNNFVIAPKLGLQYKITSAFGLNVDASYNFISGRSYSFNSFLVGGGGFFKIGNK